VLITGAAGFVGRATWAALAAAGYEVRAAVRTLVEMPAPARVFAIDEIANFTGWQPLLEGVDAVVHLANLAHVGRGASVAYARTVNVEATARLADAAASAGVRRFVYLSSAKVHGEETEAAPLNERSSMRSVDAYAGLKAEAEARLAQIEGRGGMDVVVLRPPLTYGPGVKANFLALLRALERRVPLPFASISNRRSLLYVGNLADAIRGCLESQAAGGNAYLVCDGEAQSTPQLCRAIGEALDKPARLFAFPPRVLDLARGMRRLTRSFELDGSAIGRTLGWRPPYTMEEGLRETVRWFRRG
jgi:nucleoside-diphosphate-sugar epimerase